MFKPSTFLYLSVLIVCMPNKITAKNEGHINIIQSKKKMKIIVNSSCLDVELENNETSKELVKSLPFTIKMKDLNNNEKYYYLEKDLPSKPTAVKQIQAGDIMLYGENCIVIFYKSFSTSYTYTKIGRITNADDLEKVLEKGEVEVRFQ